MPDITVNTRTRTVITLTETDLEAILQDYGRTQLNLNPKEPVDVEIRCSSGGYVTDVIIIHTRQDERPL